MGQAAVFELLQNHPLGLTAKEIGFKLDLQGGTIRRDLSKLTYKWGEVEIVNGSKPSIYRVEEVRP